MRKLVTHFSLRLGLELLGKENCIELRQILWGCKRRNPQNLAGSVPDVPTSANILTQKKEQKSLLLESVIPERFERSTHSLEGCCSIQLSYGTNTPKTHQGDLGGAKVITFRQKSKNSIKFIASQPPKQKKEGKSPPCTIFPNSGALVR